MTREEQRKDDLLRRFAKTMTDELGLRCVPISPEWLADKLADAGLKIVEADK